MDRTMELIPSENFTYSTLITVPEAAKYLGLGRKMVYQLIEFGELRAVRKQGGVRVDKNSLVDYQESARRI
jgi:excisionase family DNA binding protein